MLCVYLENTFCTNAIENTFYITKYIIERTHSVLDLVVDVLCVYIENTFCTVAIENTFYITKCVYRENTFCTIRTDEVVWVLCVYI